MEGFNYYVYAYFEPRSDVPFYIGKGRGRRAYNHLGLHRLRMGLGPFYDKLREMHASGIRPCIEILCGDLDEDEAFECERALIDNYGRSDRGLGPLLNHTDGGRGAPGRSNARAKAWQPCLRALFPK